MTKQEFDPVIIIGMHRSGTSMISRMIEALGLFQGKEKDPNNEAFFFSISTNGCFVRAAAHGIIPGRSGYCSKMPGYALMPWNSSGNVSHRGKRFHFSAGEVLSILRHQLRFTALGDGKIREIPSLFPCGWISFPMPG